MNTLFNDRGHAFLPFPLLDAHPPPPQSFPTAQPMGGDVAVTRGTEGSLPIPDQRK